MRLCVCALLPPRPLQLDLHVPLLDSHLFVCSSGSMLSTERTIQAMIESRFQKQEHYSLSHFRSVGMVHRDNSSDDRLCIYILDLHDDFARKKVKADNTAIKEIASDSFLETRPTRVIMRMAKMLKDYSQRIAVDVVQHPATDGEPIPVTVTYRKTVADSLLTNMTELLTSNDLVVDRKFVEAFANGQVAVTLYLAGSNDKAAVDKFCKQLELLFLVPQTRYLTSLFIEDKLTAEEYAYAVCVSKYLHYFTEVAKSEDAKQLEAFVASNNDMSNRLKALQLQQRRDVITETSIQEAIVNNVPLVKELYADFMNIIDPTTAAKPAVNQSLVEKIGAASVATDERPTAVLRGFVDFNASVRKTNFLKSPKGTLAFRMDATGMAEKHGYPMDPYGIFFVLANDFQGFHVRFDDVARGGIRLIGSRDKHVYAHNRDTQFQENYNLAFTQNLKNKDIPEFGSKGTVLPAATAQRSMRRCFEKYISGIMDLLLIEGNQNIVDHYNKEEILFMGPDEGTADVMEWACQYARRRGYPFWKAFTTGKPPVLGGIPHDTYGMTTQSVHAYVVGTLGKLGLDESQITKFQTGGPDGDLGSNEILISKDKTTSIVDKSGVAHDPNGLDREELTRLAKERLSIGDFDKSKLGPGGFLVLEDDRNVTLPNGDKVAIGASFRDTFHLNPLSNADLFVPCGGRPNSVNTGNMHKMLNEDGSPRFKIIVEGANLFITQSARQELEGHGIHMFKDASTNKGGVTSSSLEVLAALAMTDAEFAENMSVQDPESPPQFYQDYVEEIQQIINENARLEFEILWKLGAETGKKHCDLTDELSEKIVGLQSSIAASPLYAHKKMRVNVLSEAIPKTLLDKLGLDTVLERVPENYIKAIFSANLASRYVYHHGGVQNEMDFFTFMSKYME